MSRTRPSNTSPPAKHNESACQTAISRSKAVDDDIVARSERGYIESRRPESSRAQYSLRPSGQYRFCHRAGGLSTHCRHAIISSAINHPPLPSPPSQQRDCEQRTDNKTVHRYCSILTVNAARNNSNRVCRGTNGRKERGVSTCKNKQQNLYPTVSPTSTSWPPSPEYPTLPS